MTTGPFYFRPLTSQPKTHEILGFDVEGVGGPGGFVCGAIVGVVTSEFYTDREAFWEALMYHALEGSWCFAHNLEYDLPIAAGKDLWNGQLTFTPTRLLWAAYRRRGRRARFLDSLNLFPRWSVSDLGELSGLPKLDEGSRLVERISHGARWADLTVDERRLARRYCSRDADVVFRAVSELQELLLSLGGELKPTIAGCSMDLFRRQYLRYPWRTLGPDTDRVVRPAFYGGRTENFVMGSIDQVNLYDMNSLYPSVQREVPFPHTGHLEICTGPSAFSALDRWEGAASAVVDVPEIYVPPLPYRAEDRLFFPTGRLEGVWTLLELRRAIEAGATLRQLHWVVGSPVRFNPFQEFTDELWRQRQGYLLKDDSRHAVVKLLLNSLYGRFGISDEGGLYELRPIEPDPDWSELKGVITADLDGELVGYGPIPNLRRPAYANVLIAAQVAAAGRIRLYDELVRQDVDLAYCDTDSIITRGELPTGDGLGAWRPQMQRGTADLIGPKEYVLHDHVLGETAVVKGVPEDLARQYIATGAARFRRAVKVREAIARHLNPSEWVEAFRESRPYLPKRLPALLPDQTPSGFVLTTPWPVEHLRQVAALSPGAEAPRVKPRGPEFHPVWVQLLAQDLGVPVELLRKPSGSS